MAVYGALYDLSIIKPKRADIAQLTRRLILAVETTTKSIRDDVDQAIGTFTPATKPVFTDGRAVVSGGRLVGSVITDSNIFRFLDEGTKERWAIMNNPFESKTAPGRTRSGAGVRTYNKLGYYTAIRGRAAMQRRGLSAQRGITARKFSRTIADKHSPILARNVDAALRRSGL